MKVFVSEKNELRLRNYRLLGKSAANPREIGSAGTAPPVRKFVK